jgi:hypothetical protein
VCRVCDAGVTAALVVSAALDAAGFAAGQDVIERVEEHAITLATRVHAAAGQSLSVRPCPSLCDSLSGALSLTRSHSASQDGEALPPVVGRVLAQAFAAASLALGKEHWAVVRLALAEGQFHAASLQLLARALHGAEGAKERKWTRRTVRALRDPFDASCMMKRCACCMMYDVRCMHAVRA